MKKKKCEHKWIPNGMIIKKSYADSGEGNTYNPAVNKEKVIISCICEKCGKIKSIRE